MRMVYEIYTEQGLSINAIARLLNERQIPTRTGKSRWERSRSGAYCAIRHIVERPATARRNCGRVNGSRDRCANEKDCRVAIAPTTSDRRRSGFRFRCQRWSARRCLHWRRSSWRRTENILPGARSSRPCCKGCWSVNSAVMRCTALQPVRASISCTIIGASDRMAIGDCADQCVRIVRSGRIIWIRSYGTRSSGCWKIPL